MDTDQLLTDALTLMGLGMGTVFVFLTLLVYATALMSSLVTRFVPAARPAAVPPAAAPEPAAPAAAEVTAVIAAAIHAHRTRR